MEIPVLIEPIASGYRASTQTPVPLSADGCTADEAMNVLSANLKHRLQNRAELRILHLRSDKELDKIHQRMIANPLYPEFLKSIEEYRKVANAVENVD